VKGSVFRRCHGCRAKVVGAACSCGSETSSWAFRVDIGSETREGRSQKLRSGFESRQQAERALRDLLHKVDRDRYVDRNDLTVRAYLETEWLPAVAPPNLRQSTWSSYSGELRRHVFPTLGSAQLQNLRPSHLNRLYAELLASGRRDGRGGLSPRTVRYIHTVIRKALSDAVRWGLLERNPADLADPPRRNTERQRRMMKTWSSEQLAQFLDHASTDRLYPAWHLAATTGMRRGEVLGLRWSDLELPTGTLAVRQTYVSIDGSAQISSPKTSKSRRSVDVDDDTVSVLAQWEAAQNEERRQWGAAWDEHGLVFTRENGSPIPPDGFTKRFRQLAEQAGLPILRLHDLRHTHASLLLQAGVNPKVVSERLGHHSTAFTLDVYSHTIPGMQASAAEQVADAIRQHRRPHEAGNPPLQDQHTQGEQQ